MSVGQIRTRNVPRREIEKTREKKRIERREVKPTLVEEPKREQPKTPTRSGQLERQRLERERALKTRSDLDKKLDSTPTETKTPTTSTTPTETQPTPVEPKPEIPPEREKQLRTYDAEKITEPKGSTVPQIEGQRLASALRGETELGALNDAEKKLLLDSSMRRWTGVDQPTGERTVNQRAINELALTAQKTPELRSLVADDYLQRSANIIQARKPGERESVADRTLATTLTANAMFTLPDAAERRVALEKLGPERSFLVSTEIARRPTEPLSTEGSPRGIHDRVQVANQMLEAATTGPVTDTSRAIVDASFANLDAQAYEQALKTSPNMAKALAQHWYPDDADKQAAEEKRLGGILGTHQGIELLAADGAPNSTYEQRVRTLDLFRQNPSWDAAMLTQTSSGYTNPEVMRALAAPRFQQYSELRGDQPQTLSGTNLENTIGASMGLTPEGIPENETEAQRDAREKLAAEGNFNYFAGSKTSAVVQPVADQIRAIGGDDPQVTVLPIQYSSSETGIVELPLYRVQDRTTGADKFVDNTGRAYESFEAWKQENKLPYGVVIHPPQGHLTPGAQAEVSWTPKSSVGEQAKAMVDKAVLVGGIVAGGAMVIGSGGALAPVVLGAGAAWSAYRSSETLIDRAQHNQTINPLKDSEARSAWIDLAASGLSVASMGATSLASRAVQTGSKYSSLAATSASLLRVGASSVDLVAAGSSGYTLAANWDKLSGAERAQLALSVGFWSAQTLGAGKLSGKSTLAPFNFKEIRKDLLYGHLSPELRTEVDRNLTRLGPQSESDLASIVGSQEFKRWTPSAQRSYLMQLGMLSGDEVATRAAAFRLRAASLRAPTGQELEALERSAVTFTDPEQIPGFSGGAVNRGGGGKYLTTNQLDETILPYSQGPRPQVGDGLLFASEEWVEKAKVSRVSDVIFTSETSGGSGGLVRLGQLEDGTPVAMKTLYPDGRYAQYSAEKLKSKVLAEAREAKLLSDLGVGPRFHGVYQDQDGRWSVVTDVVTGDSRGTRVTAQTFDDLETILGRMKKADIDPQQDMELMRSKNGRLQVIDAAGTSNGVGNWDPSTNGAGGVATNQRMLQLAEADPMIARDYLRKLAEREPRAYQGLLQRMKQLTSNPKSQFDERTKALFEQYRDLYGG